MKLELAEHCFGTSLDVDGKDFNDLSPKGQKSVALKLLQTIAEHEDLFEFVCRTVEQYGKTEYGHICEQCGDWNTKITLEI